MAVEIVTLLPAAVCSKTVNSSPFITSLKVLLFEEIVMAEPLPHEEPKAIFASEPACSSGANVCT